MFALKESKTLKWIFFNFINNKLFYFLEQCKSMSYVLLLEYFGYILIFLCLNGFWWGSGSCRQVDPLILSMPVLTSWQAKALLLLNLWNRPRPCQSWTVQRKTVLSFFFLIQVPKSVPLCLTINMNPAFPATSIQSCLGFCGGLCSVVYWVRNIFVMLSAPTLPVAVVVSKEKLIRYKLLYLPFVPFFFFNFTRWSSFWS